MKRYVKCSRNSAWEKQDPYRYLLYDGDDFLACVYKHATDNVWTVYTDNYTSSEYTLSEAKKSAEKLINTEAEAAISNMERSGYSTEEMQDECQNNPYLRYMGIMI